MKRPVSDIIVAVFVVLLIFGGWRIGWTTGHSRGYKMGHEIGHDSGSGETQRQFLEMMGAWEWHLGPLVITNDNALITNCAFITFGDGPALHLAGLQDSMFSDIQFYTLLTTNRQPSMYVDSKPLTFEQTIWYEAGAAVGWTAGSRGRSWRDTLDNLEDIAKEVLRQYPNWPQMP